MTRSARSSSAGGIVSPSARATLLLITSSNFDRLLDGQIGRLGAAQDAVDVRRRPQEQLEVVHTVGDEAAFGGDVADDIGV